jgi:hypothetical protein
MDQPPKTPAQWTVEEIKATEGGAETWIQIKPSGSYEPTEWWPKLGEVLVVKEES